MAMKLLSFFFMDAINTWPENERPREKLIKYGADKLSNAELLAIFLRSGVKGKTALELARDLLKIFGNLRELLTANTDDFSKIKGMVPAKISQLKAVLELSSRYLEEETQKKSWVNSSQSVYRFLFNSLRDLKYELFKAIFLNAQNEIIGTEDLAKGSLVKNSVSPKEFVSLTLKYNAAGVILAHNHPSGNPTPSQKDKKATAKIMLICRLMEIRLLDHIIIGNNCYYSFADKGLI